MIIRENYGRQREHRDALTEGGVPSLCKLALSEENFLRPWEAHGLLRSRLCAPQVPFESLRRTTRERKYVIDEVQTAMSTLHEASIRPCTAEEGDKTLSRILNRLEGLKRKVGFSLDRYSCV